MPASDLYFFYFLSVSASFTASATPFSAAVSFTLARSAPLSDFKAAFYPGRDDKGISTQEFDGVELAAIQGLNEKVESGKQKAESRMEKLEAENAELKRRLERLEQKMSAKNGGAQ